MQRTKDPGAIPIDQFYYLQNVRVVGDGLEARGGQSKAITDPLDGCLLGIFDDGEDNLGNLRMVYQGAAFKMVDSHDVTYGSFTNGPTLVPTVERAKVTASFDGLLIYQTTSYSANDYNDSPGTSTAVGTTTGDSGFTYSTIIHGDLIVAAKQFGNVYTWTGETGNIAGGQVVKIGNDLGPNTGYVFYSKLASHAGNLYYGSGDTLKIYDTGTTWTTITLPALTKLEIAQMRSYQEKLLVMGYDDLATDEAKILQVVDETTCTVVNSPAGTIVYDGIALNGIFYYVWRKTGGDLVLGKYDGFTWTDEFKNLTTQFSYTANGAAYSMQVFNGCLWIGGVGGGGAQGYLIHSPQEGLDGTWTAIESGLASGVGGLTVILWNPDRAD